MLVFMVLAKVITLCNITCIGRNCYDNHIHLYLPHLDKAEACLKESEKLLVESTEGDHKDNSTSLECLRDMKMTSKDISQQLSG